MVNTLLVGIGGMLGCVSRYAVGLMVVRLVGVSSFPYGTLAVNVLGSLSIGLIAGGIFGGERVAKPIEMFLVVGFLGGFTTYSAFALQTVMLARDGHAWLAVVNIAANNLLSLLAVCAGIWLVLEK